MNPYPYPTESRSAVLVGPGDVVLDPTTGTTARVYAGPSRSSRAPGRVAFLGRRSDGSVVTFAVADTDRLEVVR